jgi:hypothetical protein
MRLARALALAGAIALLVPVAAQARIVRAVTILPPSR